VSIERSVNQIITKLQYSQRFQTLIFHRKRIRVFFHFQFSKESVSESSTQQLRLLNPIRTLTQSKLLAMKLKGTCFYCHKVTKTKACRTCKEVGYCDSKCQLLDWDIEHKYICGKTLGMRLEYSISLTV
jgi:hypothetical protein